MNATTREQNTPVVLITGCAGLIGTRVAEALAPRYSVVGMDVVERPEHFRGADWLVCDLTEDDSVASALAELRDRHGGRLASVVHLAAYYDFSGEPSPLYEDLTVAGTARLLKGLQGFAVEQFIFSSTLLVMEPAEEGEVLSAGSPTQAEWEYPRSKLAAEHVIRQERGPIPALILRIAGVYDENGSSLPIAQQIDRIYNKDLESYFFPGDKDHGQSFVHLDDLVRCFEQAIERRHDLNEYEVLLIGEEEVLSYEQLQERLGELIHDRQWPTIRIPKAAAKAGAWVKEKLAPEGEKPFIKPWMIDLADQHYPISLARARTVLHWQPKHTLAGTLAEMVRRLKQDPASWFQKNKLPVPEEVS